MRTAVGLIALVAVYVISTATISVVAMKAAMHRTEQQTQKPGVPTIKRSSDTIGGQREVPGPAVCPLAGRCGHRRVFAEEGPRRV
jgi:hypothetical protein